MKLFSYHTQPKIDNNNVLIIPDHLGGFDCNYFSPVLTDIVTYANELKIKNIDTAYIFDDKIKKQYPDITFRYVQSIIGGMGWETLAKYDIHPEINFKNFTCSFNGSPHVSRKLLVSILQKFGYFNTDYCSKNFSYSTEIIDGHISDFVGDNELFYRKFFIADNSEDFFQTQHSFGHVRFDHARNIYNLENKLTQSFIHLVSETLATSYQPFVTEKFLYSVVSRGLFLSYAQPGWHDHVEKYYGFNKYTKLFDYRFDAIQNPVERLVELICMVSKFSTLSTHDWHDLYLIEQDTVEYNYNHYFSGDYLKCLNRQC
jgi:hypothetical protein